MILGEKRAEYSHAIQAAVQFRMMNILICKSDIVPFILCGCEICCLMSREEHRLRVCESRVARRMFGVTGR